MGEAVKLYTELGYPALEKGGQAKKLIGYFLADTGMINQLVHLWKLDDDALDVVARSVGQRCPALQQVRPEALHGQSGRTQRREGALAALLERELPAFVAAPLHLGLAQATLESGMAGQENSMQELGLLHDDPATGANDARKLGKRPARLLDVV